MDNEITGPQQCRARGSGRRALLAAAAITVVLAACSEPVTAPAGDARGVSPALPAAPAPSAEEQALGELARAMALALNDQGLRQRLGNDMRASRHSHEQKLPAQEYLKGASGGILLAKMAQHSGVSRDSLRRLLAAVRPLELYFPVPAHRTRWLDASSLLVATALDEEVAPTAYDATGRAVALQRDSAPQQPTLVLTTRETDFSRVLPDAHPIPGAADDQSAVVSDGGWDCYACDDGYTPPPPKPFSYPPGRYMTFSYINDLKEPWFRGDPEIEVHIQGPPGPKNLLYGADLACASAGSLWPRAFDQNDHAWSGHVMLFSAQQAAEYAEYYSEGYNVTVWEDDDGPCVLKLDNTGFRQALEAIASVWAFVSVLPTRDPLKIGGAFIAAVYQSAGWLLTNDDFLGLAVPAEAAPAFAEGATHVLFLNPSTINGRIVLKDF